MGSTSDNQDVSSLFKNKVLLEPASEKLLSKLNSGRNANKIKEDVETIKKWLSLQKHLPQITSDRMIEIFLVGCKFSLERTKQKLDAYYTIRRYMPSFFDNRDPLTKEAVRSRKAILLFNLPKLHPTKGFRIVMTSLKIKDPSEYNVKEEFKRLINNFDILVQEDIDGFSTGCLYILDASGFSLGHAVKLSPSLVKDILYIFQDVYPGRINGIIFYNAPSILENTINSVVKPFLKKKMADRLHVHSEDYRVIYKYVPKEILPKNFGGDEEETDDILNELWSKKVESYRNWFITEGSVKTDESKRENKNSNQFKDNNFGLDGSFRKLELD